MSAPSPVSSCVRNPRPRAGASRPRALVALVPRLASCLLVLALAACASHAPRARDPLSSATSGGEAPRADASQRQAFPAAGNEASDEAELRARDRVARNSMDAAHRLIAEGRLEHALHWTGQGLEAVPDHPQLLRLRADVLERLGRAWQGAELRARADALAPRWPPLEETALPSGSKLGSELGLELSSELGAELASEPLHIFLLPPHAPGEQRNRYPADWPEGEVANTLLARLAVRLPRAVVTLIRSDAPASVDHARHLIARPSGAHLLSLRVDRAVCDRSPSSPGWPPFAMARIRWTQLRPARVSLGRTLGTAAQADVVRLSLDYPPWRGDCRSQIVAYALEEVLRLAHFGRAPAQNNEAPGEPPFAVPGSPPATHSIQAANSVPWSAADLRNLFPSLEQRLQRELAAGLAALSQGSLDAAQAAFERALEVDPDDLDALSYRREVADALALSHQLDTQRRSRLSEFLNPGTGTEGVVGSSAPITVDTGD